MKNKNFTIYNKKYISSVTIFESITENKIIQLFYMNGVDGVIDIVNTNNGVSIFYEDRRIDYLFMPMNKEYRSI